MFRSVFGFLLLATFATLGHAENGREWAVSYIAGHTWHSTPEAAEEYARLYEHGSLTG